MPCTNEVGIHQVRSIYLWERYHFGLGILTKSRFDASLLLSGINIMFGAPNFIIIHFDFTVQLFQIIVLKFLNICGLSRLFLGTKMLFSKRVKIKLDIFKTIIKIRAKLFVYLFILLRNIDGGQHSAPSLKHHVLDASHFIPSIYLHLYSLLFIFYSIILDNSKDILFLFLVGNPKKFRYKFNQC